MFDLNFTKLLILGVIGLVIFGPDQLPKMAAQAGRALREVRKLAVKARADLSEGLGSEFADFDLADLNPKAFMRKHLLEDIGDDVGDWRGSVRSDMFDGSTSSYLDDLDSFLLPGEVPPYDTEAT